MTIAVGTDHAGFDLAETIARTLVEQGHKVLRCGAPSTDRFDYPVASDELAEVVLSGKAEFGVLVCGSGIGVSIRANRYSGIRAALCTSVEMAELSRAHNYANVLCLGARITPESLAIEIVDAFLRGPEDRSERHAHRVELLDADLC